MAQWYKFNVVFIEVPSEASLESLNKELYQEDYDAPAITKDGCEATWRSPQLDHEELQKLFNKHGIECKFQFWEFWSAEDGPWLHEWFYSSPLVEAKEKILPLSETERDQLLNWLKK